MPINQQELAEAIEAIQEGGQALGVSCEDVYRYMAKHDHILFAVFEAAHCEELLAGFDYMFDRAAEHLLTEALRAKQEVENGLL